MVYVNSRFNAGIAPWNFGYSIGSSYWYGNNKSETEIQAYENVRKENKYFAHGYTDRKLYLPGEQVFFKSIFRKSEDLSIDAQKNVSVVIKTPK